MSDNPPETLGTQPEAVQEDVPSIEPVPEVEQEVVTKSALADFKREVQHMLDEQKKSMKQSMTDRDKLIRDEIAAKTEEWTAIAAAAGLSEAAKAAGVDRIKTEVAQRHIEADRGTPAPASPPDPQEVERVLKAIRKYEVEADVYLLPGDRELNAVADLGDNPTPEQYEKVYLQAVQAKAKRIGKTVVSAPAASTAARSASVLSGQASGGSRIEQLTKRLMEIQEVDALGKNRDLNKERQSIKAEMEALDRRG